MERVVPFFNKCVSFVAFITTLSLVIYMLVAFVTGTMDVAVLMFDTVFLSPVDRQQILNSLNGDFLHNVAVLLILMKAYRILVDYMRFHHVDIKFMVEIGIIAGILELLFNSSEYTSYMQLLLAAMTVSFLAIYVFRYDSLVKAMEDSKKDMKAVAKSVKIKRFSHKVTPEKVATKKVAKKVVRKTVKKVVKKRVVKKA